MRGEIEVVDLVAHVVHEPENPASGFTDNWNVKPAGKAARCMTSMSSANRRL
jgi:hypothetical protein